MASLLRFCRSSVALTSLPSRSTAGVRLWSSSNESKDSKEVAVPKEGEGVTEYVTPEELVPVDSLSGVPEEQLERRVARIFMPARNAMQSGTHNINHWQLEFDTQERWENPLMGWASSGDPLSNMSLTFDTVEEAVAYAVKNGWNYEIQQPKRTTPRPKSYAANFSWDKNTRVVTK